MGFRFKNAAVIRPQLPMTNSHVLVEQLIAEGLTNRNGSRRFSPVLGLMPSGVREGGERGKGGIQAVLHEQEHLPTAPQHTHVHQESVDQR